MVIYFGADHRGFNLKEYLKEFVKNQGYEIFDVGAAMLEPGDDYPEYARAVGKKVSLDPRGSRGILVCGSGVGMDVAANKFKHVRAAFGASADEVASARHDDDVNVLALGADFLSEEEAAKIVKAFLSTQFAEQSEKYHRRIEEIGEIEGKS